MAAKRPSLDSIFGGKDERPPLDTIFAERAPEQMAVEAPKGLLRSAADAAADAVETAGGAALRLAAPVLEPVARTLDRFVVAPAAKGLMTARENLATTPVSSGVLAAAKQLTEDPSTAPRMRDVAKAYGVPDTRRLSELVPGLFNETGQGIQFEKGGMLDADLQGVAGFLGEGAVLSPAVKAAGATVRAGAGAAKRGLMRPSAKAAAEAAEKRGLLEAAKKAANATEIEAAAKRLAPDSPVPPYMLTTDVEAKRLADVLLEGPPTRAASAERAAVRPYYDAADDFAKALDQRAGTLTKFETGSAVKGSLQDRVVERFAPAEALYGELEGQFSKLPLESQAFQRGLRGLRREFKTDSEALKLIDQIEADFAPVKTVEDLRKFRTVLGGRINRQTATPNQTRVLNEAYGLASRARDREIQGAMLKGRSGRRRSGQYAPETEKAAQDTLAKLREADELFKRAIGDTSEALGVEPSRRFTGRQAIEERIANATPEQLTNELFNRGDVGGLRRMQQTFPDEFELLRQRSLRDLLEQSSKNGQVSVPALVRNASKLAPEVREMLLGDLAPKFSDVRTVMGALPERFNPSGTATKNQWLDFLRTALNPERRAQEADALLTRTQLRGLFRPDNAGPGMLSRTASPEGAKDALGLLRGMAKRGAGGAGLLQLDREEQRRRYR